MFPFNFLVEIGQVDDLLLLSCGWKLKQEEVMALAGGDLRCTARLDLAGGDVVYADISVVPLAPLLGKHTIEPLIKTGNKVAPLENFQSFLLRLRSFRKQKEGTGCSAQCPGAGDLDEVSPSNSLTRFPRHLGFLRPLIRSPAPGLSASARGSCENPDPETI